MDGLATLLILALFFVFPVAGLTMIVLATRTARPSRCSMCNYDMRGLPRRARCPECGTPRHPGSRGVAIRSRTLLNVGIGVFLTPFVLLGIAAMWFIVRLMVG